MASSSSDAINKGSQGYPYPIHVNVDSFVPFKLSNKNGYRRWRKQIMCLVESSDMVGMIDGTLTCPSDDEKVKYKEWKRADALVKGWIFGSLSEEAMDMVVGLHTAHEVWKKLKSVCTSTPYGVRRDNSTHDTGLSTLYIPLHKAILKGNWEEAHEFLQRDQDAWTAKLNVDGDSLIHVAIGDCEKIQFFENLLEEMNPDLLTVVNNHQQNALHLAAMVDNTIAAQMVVEKNPHLLFLVDRLNCLPIHRAIFNLHKTTFLYLLQTSKQYIGMSREEGHHSPFEGVLGVQLITNVIYAGLFDVAHELIKEFPSLARTKEDNYIPLQSIATKWDAYLSGSHYSSYQRLLYSYIPIENNSNDAYNIRDVEEQETHNAKCRTSCFYSVAQNIYLKFWNVAPLLVPHIKQIQEDKVKHKEAIMLMKCICKELCELNTYQDVYEHYGYAFTEAVKKDTPEAIKVIVDFFPLAIWSTNNNYYISQLAIINRSEKVYNFIRNRVSEEHIHKVRSDDDGNNLLHLAGQLAPIHKLNRVPGAALQMQRELQWFKEVEKFVLPSAREKLNDKSETPIMVFRREHKKLREDGEEWMKKTADSYTITAALIITIAFAAAITVPGGNNSDTGKAIYQARASFIIFAIFIAISLFTSTNSLLLFLSILTARYQEDDFLYRLPKRLALGLAMLFLSVTSMLVAFSATLYLLFEDAETWILIPIGVLTCLPIVSFVTLQFPLLFDVIYSTYGHRIFVK